MCLELSRVLLHVGMYTYMHARVLQQHCAGDHTRPRRHQPRPGGAATSVVRRPAAGVQSVHRRDRHRRRGVTLPAGLPVGLGTHARVSHANVWASPWVWGLMLG